MCGASNFEIFEDDPVFFNVSYKTEFVYQSSYREHFHKSEYEIYYLVSGEKNFYANEKNFFLRSGDVMFIPPKTRHRSFCSESGMFSNRIVCLFSTDFISPALSLANSAAVERLLVGGVRKISLSPVGRSVFEILMKNIYEEMQYNDESSLCMRQMLTLQLIICLLRNGIPDAGYEGRSRTDVNIENIKTYIENNLNQELTLSGLASVFYMNSSALARSFKNNTGQSVMSYINQHRIEQAKELLEERNSSVAEVSAQVGFKTPTYFERLFKRATGFTPKQYKDRLRIHERGENV